MFLYFSLLKEIFLPSYRDFSLHTNFSRTPSTLHFYSIPHYSIFYTFVSTTPPLRPGARAAWHHSQGPRQGSGGVFLSLQAWRCPFSLPTMEFIVEVWAAAFSTPNNSSKRVGEWWRCGVRIVLAHYHCVPNALPFFFLATILF